MDPLLSASILSKSSLTTLRNIAPISSQEISPEPSSSHDLNSSMSLRTASCDIHGYLTMKFAISSSVRSVEGGPLSSLPASLRLSPPAVAPPSAVLLSASNAVPIAYALPGSAASRSGGSDAGTGRRFPCALSATRLSSSLIVCYSKLPSYLACRVWNGRSAAAVVLEQSQSQCRQLGS